MPKFTSGGGTPVTGMSPSSGVELTPTPEQAACIEAYLTGENTTVSALAGTGKTSALKMMGRADGRRGLYLAFNRVTADEAALSFSQNINCMTGHSLAYRWAAQQWPDGALQTRLRGNRVTPVEVAKILGADYVRLSSIMLAPHQVARFAMEMVQNFCNSGDELPQVWHMPRVVKVDSPDERRLLAELTVPLARKAWEDLSRPDGKLRFTHDCYFAGFVRSNPQLPYDVIFVDEAQDSSGAMIRLVRDQNAQVVAVGDANQSLYQWRGAISAMDAFEAAYNTVLTASWRFGAAVADEANKWLEILESPLKVVPGNPNKVSRLEELGTTAGAVLCRTNAEAVSEVMACHAAGRKVAIVGGGGDIVKFAEAAIQLKVKGKTSHPDLFPFKAWIEVQDYCDSAFDGGELKTWVKLIDTYGAGGVIQTMKDCVNFGVTGMAALEAEQRADVVVSTGHRGKGREWSTVRIAADFADREPREDPVTGVTPNVNPAEAMLAYVAVTRAKDVLDRGGLAWVDRWTEGPPAAWTPTPREIHAAVRDIGKLEEHRHG